LLGVINGIISHSGSHHYINLGSEGCFDMNASIIMLTCSFMW